MIRTAPPVPVRGSPQPTPHQGSTESAFAHFGRLRPSAFWAPVARPPIAVDCGPGQRCLLRPSASARTAVHRPGQRSDRPGGGWRSDAVEVVAVGGQRRRSGWDRAREDYARRAQHARAPTAQCTALASTTPMRGGPRVAPRDSLHVGGPCRAASRQACARSKSPFAAAGPRRSGPAARCCPSKQGFV